MEKENKEIPFGAKDSELYKFEYAIPEGMEAIIDGNKVIIRKKESKDERIRKDIIALIEFGVSKGSAVSPGSRTTKEEALAYLEKLKESQPLMRDGEIEDKKRDIVAAIRKYYPTDYAEYLTSFLKGLSPEDNSEDEYGQEMLGIAYKLMYEHIPENLRTQEFWDSLKFMREYTGRVAIIHSYEKPAEWSEEDEKDIQEASEYLRDYANNCVQGGNSKLYLQSLADRIESLRPQPHWKPSEEQMKALNEVANNGVLLDLFNDLLKLL